MVHKSTFERLYSGHWCVSPAFGQSCRYPELMRKDWLWWRAESGISMSRIWTRLLSHLPASLEQKQNNIPEYFYRCRKTQMQHAYSPLSKNLHPNCLSQKTEAAHCYSHFLSGHGVILHHLKLSSSSSEIIHLSAKTSLKLWRTRWAEVNHGQWSS